MISDYTVFQAKLYPLLPVLLYQAFNVRRKNPTPPAISEELTLGEGKKNILILGESTAAGVGASSVEFTLANNLYGFLGTDYRITNLGKNGLRVAQTYAHFGDKISGIKDSTDGIFIFLGANDCFKLTHPKKFRNQLDHLISTLNSDFSPSWIYLADIPPVHLFPAFPSILQSYLKTQRHFLQQEMKAICAENNRIIWDQLKLDFNPDFFAVDGVHPSDEGYQRIAAFTLEGLKARNLV